MDHFWIEGGRRLEGVTLAGAAKNAVLPLLAASILPQSPVRLVSSSRLSDIDNMLAILHNLGCAVEWDGRDIIIDPRDASEHEMPEKLAKELRSSIFMLGPILARFGRATVTYPGGCEIGLRPIDLHLKGLRALGASIEERDGFIYCSGKLTGANFHLDYPSVGATENVMMAAVLAEGTTHIHNAAQEPEICDLANFLRAMGARVSGAGTGIIEIEGVKALHGVCYSPMPDRIVAGTLLGAAAVTGGDVLVSDARPSDMSAIIAKYREMGCDVTASSEGVRLVAPARLKAFNVVETCPHPGYPTDMQAQATAVATVAQGTSVIVENVFENRFGHVPELLRMGADILVQDRTCVIRGVTRLIGTRVCSRDLRCGAALVIAGLAAEGTTVVDNIHLIDRGYDALEAQLTSIGASIRRVSGGA